ncbi:hypothetical protein GNI_028090 [Gregarina niphandrodes]|uniref:Uncharacterized protein n=1 Tax=Gregarina niphandrodes TaxID=110365 RepID=A0A023BBG0_GRENI|nr:hypothetical protein GNI_028090 [Gregarina niphandrodes]EZG79234.1 hypothetical protein GNI_028090 [Gregarina niphandrodes]|eukprot:XP_011129105.1 hypothetical protein GNI_028090 [Gregarina niphandrodes]
MVRGVICEEKQVPLSLLLAEAVAAQAGDVKAATTSEVAADPKADAGPVALTPEQAVKAVVAIRLQHGMSSGNAAIEGPALAMEKAFREAGEKLVKGEAVDTQALKKVVVEPRDAHLIKDIADAKKTAERFFWEGSMRSLSRDTYPSLMALLNGTMSYDEEQTAALSKLLKDPELSRILSPEMRNLFQYLSGMRQPGAGDDDDEDFVSDELSDEDDSLEDSA